jgi:ribonuclease HII
VPRHPGPSLERETAAWAERRLLIGVDEAGRGPLAGPVVAAAAVFPPGAVPIPGVRDSKTLPARTRRALARAIADGALALGLGAASIREIDTLNIRVATALAMRRAVGRVLACLEAREVLILVDGHPVPDLGHTHASLVDGDARCYSIAAAGIMAKTVRDHLMARLAARHPSYDWARNMGYGTAAHLAALRAHGPTAHHRRSFAPLRGGGDSER